MCRGLTHTISVSGSEFGPAQISMCSVFDLSILCIGDSKTCAHSFLSYVTPVNARPFVPIIWWRDLLLVESKRRFGWSVVRTEKRVVGQHVAFYLKKTKDHSFS